MRRRLLVLIAATFLGLGGPSQARAAENGAPAAGEEPAATSTQADAPTTSNTPATDAPPTGGPEQETSSESDASVDNDANLDQSSSQGQDGGTTDTGSASAADGSAQGGQEAQTAQQVQADATASSNGARNDAKTARVGAARAGDQRAVAQASVTAADAAATATQSTAQNGAGTPAASGQHSAAASANATSSDSTNTLLDARIGASGDNAGFEQSVQARAAARADLEGPENAQQRARAAATADVADARNTAVELRLASDGDSAGGRQSIGADAEASAADASAAAVLENPFNTFVSLRVNSNGTTGPVEQGVSQRETVNGSVSEQQDAAGGTWHFDANGVAIDFISNGANTDLRIVVGNPALHQPDQAPLFVWEWDMVFGPGSQPDCAISSSADATRVTWAFDCDPEDRIVRTAGATSASALPANTLSWVWNWLRPQLSGWSWDRNDNFFLPACGPTCTLLLDFRWLSLEPLEASAAETSTETSTETAVNTDVAAAIQQTNEATASAAATAESIIEQTLVQSGGNQLALQQASVAQLVTAHAVAGLVDVDNISVGIGARVTQTNRAAAQVTAAAGAEIAQMLSQDQSGASGMHTQVALQSASIAQQLSAGAVATVTHSSNSDVSVDGSSAQSATSSATATGVELAGTRQVAEQEQQGDQSDQEQLAGQWADTAQQLELLAGAGVTEARISSRLNGDSAKLDIGAAAVSTGTSLSTIQQLALQFQSGDEVAQQQESYQIASVEQSGIALAAATAGGTLHYVLVPVALRAVEQASLPEEMLLAQALPTSIEPSFVPVTAARGVAAKQSAAKPSPRPALTPLQPTIFARKQAAAPAAPLAVVPLSNDSASTAGSAGTAPKRAKDAEQAPDRTPRGQCLAPCSGASAASAGTGSGSAFVASSGYALSPVPRLGRRQSAPAGRRPAAVVLLRAKPG